MSVCISLACWPGMRHENALTMLTQTHSEPLFGELSTAHIQLVPQSFGTLTDDLVDGMLMNFPCTQFRLHANVRVLPSHRVADLSNFDTQTEWFCKAASVSQRLSAPAYSAHSGSRANADLPTMLDNARRCADLFGCPVAVEGQYPTRGEALLVASWGEYRTLFESGVPYALDLSHLNIVAAQSRTRDDGLLREMLVCERCLEIHVSDNNGDGDSHRVCSEPPWWVEYLSYANPAAVCFTEGNHRLQGKLQ